MNSIITSFYDALWGTSDLYRSIWYGAPNEAPNKSKWFTNTKEALQFVEEINNKTYNIYHSCALFSTNRKLQKNAIEINAFWADLDLCHSPCKSLKELFVSTEKLKNFEFGNDFYVIASGHGFHIYWLLETPINSADWKDAATCLHEFARKNGVHLDPKRTRDCASILRVPGTTNYKKIDKPKKIKLIKTTSFRVKTLPQKQETEKEDNKSTADNSFSETSFLASSFLKATEKCVALKQFAQTGYGDNEPAWYQALSIARLTKESLAIAHQLSAKAPNYNKNETQKKLDQLERNNIGPALCDRFRELDLCDKCALHKKIKSPIQLGIELAPLANITKDMSGKEEKKRADLLISLAPSLGWMIGKEGIYRLIDEIPVLLSHVPFYIIDIVRESIDDASVLTVIIRALTKKSIVEFNLPLKYIADDRKLLGEFNARGIFPTNKRHLKDYLTIYFQKIEHIEAHNAIASLGWQANNSFIYGDDGAGFSQTGEIINCVMDKKMRSYVRGFTTKGGLKEWQSILDIYMADPVWMPHFFSLLCSLGAPLLPLTSAKGIVLSLQGHSGTGKTLAHKAALSIWGNPDAAGVLGTRDTHTAMVGRMAAIKNMPLRLDEATLMGAAKLSGLIYELVNGRGRSRATVDGSLSNTSAEWQTLTLITTNRPLLENDVTVISEAERYRILELAVDMPPEMAINGNIIGTIIEKNYGILGKLFIEYVVKNKAAVMELLSRYTAKFQTCVADDKRFWVSCGAVAFTALRIARANKYFDCDIEKCEDWFMKLLREQTAINNNYIEGARGFDTREELIRSLADSLTGYILYLDPENNVIEKPTREIKARLVRDEAGRQFLYVRPPVLREFIRMYFVSSEASVREEFDLGNAKPKRFGAGGVVRCYEFLLST